MRDRAARVAGSVIVAVATALVIVAFAIVPFVNPVWVGFEQGRAQAAEWTGFSPTELRSATDAILSDLVLGPPAFDVTVGGRPVLTEAERGHMRDVRDVFGAFAVAAVGATVALVIAARASRGAPTFWRAVRAGSVGLVAAVVAAGLTGLVAFDTAFEVFHRLFFSGNYTFDPRTDRLVQLFPERFWFETALAVGIVIVVLAGLTAWLATRRLRPDGSRSPARQPAPQVAR